MKQKAIALIPARAGSKSIPNKNLSKIGQHSLVGHAILQCRESNMFNDIVVSTDGQRIAEEAEKYGAKVHHRDEKLASDTSLVIDTVKQFVKYLKEQHLLYHTDYLALIEPTTPLRTPQNIIDCIDLISSEKFQSVATFRKASLNPNRAWRLENGKPKPFFRTNDPWAPRQKLQPAFQLSGSVYCINLNDFTDKTQNLLFGNSGAVLVDERDSIDIDDQLDLDFVRFIFKERSSHAV